MANPMVRDQDSLWYEPLLEVGGRAAGRLAAGSVVKQSLAVASINAAPDAFCSVITYAQITWDQPDWHLLLERRVVTPYPVRTA
jgi:hypothetical protein